MTAIRASLFQTLRVVTDEGRPLDLGSPTTRSLFAYLLFHRARPADRRRLAFYFWPGASEPAARRNLRQFLHRIRRSLEPLGAGVEWVLTDGNEVQLNPQLHTWLDVEEFRRLVRPGAGLEDLQAGAALYTGDLLEDVYEDWCQEERQQLHSLYLNALERLCQGLQACGQAEAALAHAQHWCRIEPLDEAAHRWIMRLYGAGGERNRAIQHYQALEKLLQQELGAGPLPETRQVYLEIQSGAGAARPPEPPVKAPALLAAKRKNPVSTPLVGRASELASIQDLLAQARSGTGCFILVTGESGIGKTRLMQEYLELAGGALLLQNTCHELESVLPYSALKPVLAQGQQVLQDRAAPGDPAWREPLVRLLQDKLPAAARPEDQDVLESAILEMLHSLSGEAAGMPLQIILDDLHWADTPTWNVLARLARQARSQRLLIFGLCRLEDLPVERGRLIRALERNDLLVHIPLRRLSASETSALAMHLLPNHPVDSFFLNRLYQETEGNPFFIIAIAHAMRENGWSAGAAQGGIATASAAIPLSIQRVIEARLDRLAPSSQELLALAAAAGTAFTLALLEEISRKPAEEIIACIEEWQQRGLVREEPAGYDFSHDKIRQVAYNTLSRARRQYVHRQIAEMLENAVTPVEAASLAYHYARSDQPIKALPYLTRAGQQALQTRSYLEARHFGQQAVSLLGQLPGPRQRSERIDLNLQLAQAYAFNGDLSRAQEILAETESLALTLGDEARLGELFHHSAQIFWLRGQPESAGDYARRLLRSAEELNDPRLLHAALRMLGRVSIALSAYDDAIAYLLRYANLENSPSPPPDLPVILGYLGVAYTRVGSWNRAREAAGRGLELAERSDPAHISQAAAFARMQLAFVHADNHDWQTCLDVLQPVPDPLETWRDAENRGLQVSDAPLTPLGFMLLGVRGLALAHLGRAQEGAAVIRPALAWAERSDYRVFHYLPRLFLADALLQAGDLEPARQEAEKAMEHARAAGNRWSVAVTLRLLAEILTRLPVPNWPQIENHLIESMTILRQVRARPDLARTYLALRRLYDRAGQIAWAVDCHFRATTIFEELGMTGELRQAQGQAAHDRRGARVIPGLALRGPNAADDGGGPA